MQEIKTGPVAPKKSSGGAAQAVTMILAWVGGAAAAAAVAFWILQYVRPPEDPNLAEKKLADTNQTVAQERSERKERKRRVAPKSNPRKSERISTQPKTEVVTTKINQRNFQRPDSPGLVYRYFEGDSFGMKDFAKIPATRSSMLTAIGDLPVARKAKGLQLEGYWETQSDQPCDFVLDSTNDARLWIDDQLVLDNTNQFEPGPVKATRTISPGMHKVRAEFLLKTQGGTFTLDVAGAGDSNRMNLDRLLRPFESDQLSSFEKLQYELASYPKPTVEAGSLIRSNQKAVATSFFETESDAPDKKESESVKAALPDDGRLLAGVAIGSSDDDRVVGLKPIYLSEAGLIAGETIGQETEEWQSLIAKPGYAVSAIQFGQFDSVNKIQSEFMQIGDKALLPEGAYTQTLAGAPVPTAIDIDRQSIIGLRGQVSGDSKLLGVEVVRVLGKKSQMLMNLAKGFPTPSDLKETPAPSVIKKRLKKLAKESASKLSGKAGEDQLMELKALASSVESSADSSVDAEAEFVTLLEARRLYLLAGDVRSAFAITNRLMHEFDYDHWKDVLALFADSASRAGSSSALKRAVVLELDPAIDRAEKQLEFEVAGRLAVGGKMITKSLKDQLRFEKYQQKLERFEQLAGVTKQARTAAKKLLVEPDDGKSNRSVGIFYLAVSEDWDEAMNYFARSANEDYQFIAEHDRSFTGADAEVAKKLADCWIKVGKKVDALTELANKRARTILEEAKGASFSGALHGQADDKGLKDLDTGLKNL